MTDSTDTTSTTSNEKNAATKPASKPLTPSAAAARKRPTQDRRSKATAKPQQAAQPPARARADLDLGVERDTVDIGFDFRPIPVRLGPSDDDRWYFHPDPDPEAYAAVQSSVSGWVGRDADDVTMEEAAELVDALRHAVAGLLYNEDDRGAFITRHYGPFALAQLARKLMEEVTGFPT